MATPNEDYYLQNYKITLEYEGRQYTFVDQQYVFYNGYGYPDNVDYMWRDGNYGCDCNRSLFIARFCDSSFPKFTCGEKIELIELVETELPQSPYTSAVNEEN